MFLLSSSRLLLLWLLLLLFHSSLIIPISSSSINGSSGEEEEGKKKEEEGIPIPIPIINNTNIVHQHRHRWRRAPAVWGEPAPDYSMAALDPQTHIYLYALLFVDLKTSDHYRREHQLVKREVMRLAREANNYFYQINLRLIVVDVLETYRDDLSLYSFEQYRNQRHTQLPFHNFAVLITYRYAGGLAFVGGMCSPKSVMLAGFYPHNPEAMASIFFHEVAHLIGVPHRPANESLDVPNCACSARRPPPIYGHPQMPPVPTITTTVVTTTTLASPTTTAFPTREPLPNVSRSSLIMHDADQPNPGPGCLKIPGFDQDCSLQMMVNLALRTRCLGREPREDPMETSSSLPLCGNGVREGNEQCDCGLAKKCAEWNCEPYTCSRRWPLWTIWLSALGLCLSLCCSLLCCLWLHRRIGHHFSTAAFPSPSFPSFAKHPRRRRPFFVAKLPLLQNSSSSASKLANAKRKNANKNNNNNWPLGGDNCGGQTITGPQQQQWIPAFLQKPFHAIWKWMKRRSRRRKPESAFPYEASPILSSNAGCPIQRPMRPPPPPPPCSPRPLPHPPPPPLLLKSASIRSPSSSLNRPKKPPPPLPRPPSARRPIIRPKANPPEPPPKRPQIAEMCWREEEEDDDEEWDDYCE